MSNRRDFIKTGTLALTGLTLAGTGKLWGTMVKEGLVSRRPVLQQRHFTSGRRRGYRISQIEDRESQISVDV